jgi:hypothetical protein
MGLFPTFHFIPAPQLADRAEDRLAGEVHVDVLDPVHLLALAPVRVERLGQRGVGATQLVREAQVHLPSLERLLGNLGASEAVHHRVVRRDHLRRQHSLDRVARGMPASASWAACSPSLTTHPAVPSPRQRARQTWLTSASVK